MKGERHMIPNIPRWHGPAREGEAIPAPPERFSVRDGLAWLGISWDDYEESEEITAERHGNPIGNALLEALAAHNGSGETAETVLARWGIDPADPLTAVRAWAKRRSRFD